MPLVFSRRAVPYAASPEQADKLSPAQRRHRSTASQRRQCHNIYSPEPRRPGSISHAARCLCTDRPLLGAGRASGHSRGHSRAAAGTRAHQPLAKCAATQVTSANISGRRHVGISVEVVAFVIFLCEDRVIVVTPMSADGVGER